MMENGQSGARGCDIGAGGIFMRSKGPILFCASGRGTKLVETIRFIRQSASEIDQEDTPFAFRVDSHVCQSQKIGRKVCVRSTQY